MIICSAFSDLCTRIQDLMRVERNGDSCLRIQNTEVTEIDMNKMIEHKGKMRNAEAQLKNLLPKPKRLEGVQVSTIEMEDKDKSYTEMMNEQ